jgi:hypothetical protein
MLCLLGLYLCSSHAFQPVIRINFLVCSVRIISVLPTSFCNNNNTINWKKKYLKFPLSVPYLCLTAEYYVSSCGDQAPDPGGACFKFPSYTQTGAFWDMTRCSFVETYRRFRRTCCLHISVQQWFPTGVSQNIFRASARNSTINI